jgi:hypothetical protein
MQQSFVSFSLALCTYTQMKSLKHTQSFKTLAKVMAISMVPINPKCLHKLHTYAILEKVWKILLQKLPWHESPGKCRKELLWPIITFNMISIDLKYNPWNEVLFIIMSMIHVHVFPCYVHEPIWNTHLVYGHNLGSSCKAQNPWLICFYLKLRLRYGTN